MDSVHVLRVLMRSWLILTLFAVAGAGGGLLVYADTAPRYESSIQIVISAPTAKGSDPLTQGALLVARAQVVAQIAPTAPAVADAANRAGERGAAVSVHATAAATAPFVTIVVQGSNPGVVQAIANSYSSSLPGTVSRVEGAADSRVSVSTLGPASYSAQPYTPHLLKNLLPGLAAGLVLGAGLIVLREVLNQSIGSADDLQALTGLRILGTVPRDNPKVALPTISDPRSLRAEAYRQVRTAVLTASGRPARSIAVTSSLPREGKTSISTNLAVALARAGGSVALVDADLHRPQVAEFLQLDPPAGLIDVLSGTIDIDDAMVSMEDGLLHVLASGRGHTEPSELLFQEGLDEAIKHLAADHDFVIVDTPPVLPIADALVIAPRMDGVILVTQLGRTRRDEITRTRTSIADAGVEIIGVVANQARRGRGRRYRYYYEPDARKGASPPVAASRPRPRPRPVGASTASGPIKDPGQGATGGPVPSQDR